MRETVRDVRAMLRAFRHPAALARSAFTVRLQRALGVASPRAAVERTIAEALSDPHDWRLARIIQLCDVEGRTTEAAAAELALSPRQFFRYRAEAIAAVAVSAERLLQSARPQPGSAIARVSDLVGLVDPPLADALRASLSSEPAAALARLLGAAAAADLAGDDEGTDAVLQSIRTESATWTAAERRYARERELWIAYERSLRRGDVERQTHIARTAAAGAPPTPAARLLRADRAVRDGDSVRAAALLEQLDGALDVETLARVALVYARIAFARSDDARAVDLANAARTLARDHAALSYEADALAGKAAISLGRSWRGPEAEGYHGAHLDAVTARHFLREGLLPQALALGERAVERARGARSIWHESYALATRALIVDANGNEGAAAADFLAAFRLFARTHDAVLSRDIFAHPSASTREIGVLANDGRLAELLWAFKEEHYRAYRLPDVQAIRKEHVANLDVRLRLALAGPCDPLHLHDEAVRLRATMLRNGLEPDRLTDLARETLHSHWFPSAAFLPLEQRETYRSTFSLIAEDFYTLIDRHGRAGVTPCDRCTRERSARRTAAAVG